MGGGEELGTFVFADLWLFCQRAEFGDEFFGFPGQQLVGTQPHPVKALLVGFTEQGIGNLPEIFIGVNEIQDQSEVGKVFGNADLQRLAPVTQCYGILEVRTPASLDLLG